MHTKTLQNTSFSSSPILGCIKLLTNLIQKGKSMLLKRQCHLPLKGKTPHEAEEHSALKD